MCFEQATGSPTASVPVAVRSGLSRPHVGAPADGGAQSFLVILYREMHSMISSSPWTKLLADARQSRPTLRPTPLVHRSMVCVRRLAQTTSPTKKPDAIRRETNCPSYQWKSLHIGRVSPS